MHTTGDDDSESLLLKLVLQYPDDDVTTKYRLIKLCEICESSSGRHQEQQPSFPKLVDYIAKVTNNNNNKKDQFTVAFYDVENDRVEIGSTGELIAAIDLLLHSSGGGGSSSMIRLHVQQQSVADCGTTTPTGGGTLSAGLVVMAATEQRASFDRLENKLSEAVDAMSAVVVKAAARQEEQISAAVAAGTSSSNLQRAADSSSLQFPKLRFDAQRMSADLQIDDKGRVVVKLNDQITGRWQNVFGSQGFASETGRYSWSVRILGTVSNHGLCVGVNKNASLDLSKHTVPGHASTPGCSLDLGGGYIRNAGAVEQFLPDERNLVQEAKTIGLLLDTDQKTLTFYADGQRIGDSIDLGDAVLYFPVVSMQKKHQRVQLVEDFVSSTIKSSGLSLNLKLVLKFSKDVIKFRMLELDEICDDLNKPSYSKLMDYISKVAMTTADAATITYCDEDNDMVTIASTRELSMAIRRAITSTATTTTIRLHVAVRASLQADFDSVRYMNIYQDLKQAFCHLPEEQRDARLREHWLRHGHGEGRRYK